MGCSLKKQLTFLNWTSFSCIQLRCLLYFHEIFLWTVISLQLYYVSIGASFISHVTQVTCLWKLESWFLRWADLFSPRLMFCQSHLSLCVIILWSCCSVFSIQYLLLDWAIKYAASFISTLSKSCTHITLVWNNEFNYYCSRGLLKSWPKTLLERGIRLKSSIS